MFFLAVLVLLIYGIYKYKNTNKTNTTSQPVSTTSQPVSTTSQPVSTTTLNTTGANPNTTTIVTTMSQPIDCVLSEWSKWGDCDDYYKTKTRTVITQPSDKGILCDVLTDKEKCITPNGRTVKNIRVDGKPHICVDKILFNIVIPEVFNKIELEYDISRNNPRADGAYMANLIIFNKTTNTRGQHILLTANKSTINLMEQSHFTEETMPKPGNKIEIMATACYTCWYINVNSATLTIS